MTDRAHALQAAERANQDLADEIAAAHERWEAKFVGIPYESFTCVMCGAHIEAQLGRAIPYHGGGNFTVCPLTGTMYTGVERR